MKPLQKGKKRLKKSSVGGSECRKQFMKGNKLNFIIAILVVIIASAMNICLAFILRFFIEAVEEASTAKLLLGLEFTGAYILAYVIFSLIRKKYYNIYFKTALSQFKDYIFEKLLSKTISQFENGASAKFLSAFSNDLNSIETNYLAGLFTIMQVALQFIAASIYLIFTNFLYGIIISAAGVIFCALSLKFGAKLVNRESEMATKNMGFIAQVKDLLNGFVVIKSFKAEKAVLGLFRKKNVELEGAKQRRRETATDVSIFSDVAAIIINIMIFGAGFYFAFSGQMTIGMVISAIQVGNLIVTPVSVLGPTLSNRRAANALITRIEEAVEGGDEVDQTKKITASGFQRSIDIKNVSFSYDDEAVLNGVNLKFERGKSYAIVGGSGSGKSTLLKLMLGYMPQYSGKILYDGVDVREMDLDSLYSQISIIQQDVFLFDSSIADNITMFSDFPEDKLHNAIERSGLSTLIEQKGLGYDCGEGGENLSGGEKQRVSIARCLIRETPVLLMDEATAALDNATALSVENSILDIDGLTRIIITHRYSDTVMSKYDEIIVMNHGAVIEQGTFDQLMQRGGYFYSLYTVSQAE